MKTVLRSLAVVIIFVLTSNVTVLAAPVNEKLQQQKDSLTRIQTEREQVEMKIEEFDNEIEKIMIKTEENKRKISETEKSIEVAAVEVKKIARESQKEQGLFNSRMRVMYINRSDGYLSIILDSESFGDFISRVDNIKTVVEFDKKLMVNFEASQKELKEKQKNLKNTKESLLSLQVENKQKIDKIMVTKESQNKLITQLKSKEIVAKELQNKLNSESKGTNISAQIIEPQVSVNKSLTKISEFKKSVPTYTPSRGGATVSQGAIIAYASNFLGTPYLWGGTTPSGFDCSGFTQYVYAHFGISVGRTTFDQINDGVEVSRDKLQPGDLVFFGSFANPHHMGMYIGNNNYIHAPHTGDVIKISALGRNDYVTARRVK
ncbi:C40 family peptidase [Clostridium estertheticum]|uniref:C40 family peptidase n=1 Tax=Clostridium estertheticum TaxID=238834 RepID=UPI001C6E3B52|nr:C40 family peptidase [Clostridium estertheticum]MBW9153133.1 C40 family peptidase [Clostridium estertheticum]WLC83698.1 C40 family peptidase [Clostridium estertheticum]